MSIKVITSTETNGLGVNTDHEALVALTQTVDNSGFASMASEKGVLPDGTRVMKKLEASEDFRLRVGLDSLMFADDARGAVVNTSVWQYPATTMTLALANNCYTLNASSITTVNTVIQLRTWRTFQMSFKGASVYGEATMLYTQIPATNQTIEGGFFNASGTSAITDGIFFRIKDGNLFCVAVNNSTEKSVDLGAAPSPNTEHNIVIEVTTTKALFWLNNELVAVIENNSATFGMTSQAQLPFAIRQLNGAVAPATAQQAKISNISVSCADLDNNRLWPTVRAGMGGGSYQAPSGGTPGSTANYANSAAPASATLSNTAAGYTTLGGQFQFAAVAGAETDYALFGYQVPVGSNILIRGVRIELFNMGAAVATTPTLCQWSLGVGSSAVSLATAEAATTKSRRVIPLGVQYLPVAAAIGVAANFIDINLDAPIMAHSAEFVHIILKMPVGTATASQILRGVVMVNGYFE